VRAKVLNLMAAVILTFSCCGCGPWLIAEDEDGDRLYYDLPDRFSVKNSSDRDLGEAKFLDHLENQKSWDESSLQ
jgi:hypothetical protein